MLKVLLLNVFFFVCLFVFHNALMKVEKSLLSLYAFLFYKSIHLFKKIKSY